MSDTVQLMIVVPCDDANVPLLTAALERHDVASVLIVREGWVPAAMEGDAGGRDAASPAPMNEACCRSLIEIAQGRNAAALIANDAPLAAKLGADGCHFDTSPELEQDYENARSLLGPDAIVGIMPGASRHDAMTLAEAGADYVGYPLDSTDPDDPGLHYIAWWAEIFECPVVAFATADIAACQRIIEAGPPDFIAVAIAEITDGERFDALIQLIKTEGQLPIAQRNAK